ncbi:hypothetical protein, partial [Kineococcus sp. SYSU DK024]|uniref:hypothetical protein n=1 Tax=Kineococcus sp. SYSU DK024 TaxID=3383145 RepID=UPI003D7E3A79
MLVVALVLALAIGVVALRLLGPERPPSSTSPPEAVAPEAVEPIFGPRSVWLQDISTAPLAEDSAVTVRELTEQVAGSYNGVAAFNVNQYNTSIYTVPASQPRVDVQWSNCQNRSYTPKG